MSDGGCAGRGGRSGGVTKTMAGAYSTMIPRRRLEAAADVKLEEKPEG
jgi:hypothetical protein